MKPEGLAKGNRTTLSRRPKRVSLFILATLILFVVRFGCVACVASIAEDDCCRERADAKEGGCDAGHKQVASQARAVCCSESESDALTSLRGSDSYEGCPMPCCVAAARDTSPAVLPGLVKDLGDGLRLAEPLAVVLISTDSALSYNPLSPPDRGGTYLRCCVLLI